MRRGGSIGVVALSLALSCAAGRGGGENGQLDLEEWASGPVRWLLLPSDRREIRGAGKSGSALNFVEAFWRLRDPDPETPDNEFRDTFLRRVEAADVLYAEDGMRGSLTARGRALVLLGAPPALQITTEPALTWNPKRRGARRAETEQINVEIWRYPPEDLPERFQGVLRALGESGGIELKFRAERRQTTLVSGEDYLLLAAKLALVRD